MTYETIPTDVASRIDSYLAAGTFTTRDQVLREAMAALDAKQQFAAELQEAFDDIEAGRGSSIEDVERDLREEFDFMRDPRPLEQ